MKDIVRRADDNLIESIRVMIKNSNKGHMVESESCFKFTLGVESMDGHLNGAFCYDDSNADKVFEEVDGYFKSRGNGYVFWIREEIDSNMEAILKSKGYQPRREPGLPIMAVYRRIEEIRFPQGYSARKVKTERDIRDLMTTIRDTFDKTEEQVLNMFGNDLVVNSKGNEAYVVYDRLGPVSCVLVVKSGDTAGIYWVGTREEARGKGLGKLIASIGTNAGFDMGAEAVILQASQLGQYVYEKLGYELVGYYRCYPIEF